jgi:RNA recognition motif-containing protein
MSFVWVQQWVPLSVVYSRPMGDIPAGSRPQTMEHTATGFALDGNQSHPAPPSMSLYKTVDTNTPFYSQLSAIPQNQLRSDHHSPSHSSAQFTPKDYGASSLNMTSMAGALPDYTSLDNASLSGASSSAVAYLPGQSLQMPAHPSNGMPGYSSYGNAYVPGPYQQQSFGPGPQHNAYPPFGTNQPRTQMQPTFQNYVQPSQYMYYPAPYTVQGHYNLGYAAQGAQSHAMYERRGSMAGATAGLTSSHNMDYSHHDGAFGGARMVSADPGAVGSVFNAAYARGQGKQAFANSDISEAVSLVQRLITPAKGMPHSGPVSSIPRGPPRKPKQSGHALWVGNLPPGTTVMALKDHFSREATKDIESLFLISKSNCAFVNYRSETTCTAAMHRFHDSRFNGVRLVCRLRRSSAPTSGIPTGPSAMVGTQQANIVSPPKSPKVDGEAVDGLQDGNHDTSPQQNTEGAPENSNSPSKYFIVKSLTLQDLELSVRNGIWATQSHNEDVLNKAFRVSLYLPSRKLHLVLTFGRLQRTSSSSSRPTNPANILATLA